MANERVIVLRGTPVRDEQNAAAQAITPGMLIDLDGSGEWIPHGDAVVNAVVFALERDEMGMDIDDAYAIGDFVHAGYFHKGERVNALIASGQTIAEGAPVEAAAGGLLTGGATAGQVVGVAAETIDTTLGQGRGAVIVQ